MGLKNIYTIDFTHPPTSIERLDFKLDKSFFDDIEGSVISDADVDLILSIEPLTDHRFEISFIYEGEVVVACDRCLQPLALPIYVEEGLELILGEHLDDIDNEQIILDIQNPVYDFSWIVYELLALHLPIQRMHDIEDCDPEFLNYLVNEIPEESEQEDQKIHPVWQSLKDKFDNNN